MSAKNKQSVYYTRVQSSCRDRSCREDICRVGQR